MAKACVHLMSWISQLDETNMNVLEKAKNMGFDGIELPMVDAMEMSSTFLKKIRTELDRLDMECLCAAGLGKNENLIDSNPEIREKGRKLLRRLIDIASELHSPSIAGPLYGTFEMSVGRGRTEEEWNIAVDSLGEAADYAKEKDVTLCLEVLNRYETYFLNTADDALSLVKEIGRDNMKIHLDTYHMNIEEKNFYDPIVACGEYLGYMHCSENDRGTPGSGHVNWDEVFQALAAIKYTGWLGIETFHGPISFIPVASSVWRKLATEDIPNHGLLFLRKKQEQYGV